MSAALRDAFRDALAADTFKSTVAAGSPSAVVIQLGAGDAANWAPEDFFMVWAPGSANHAKASRVYAIDTALDRLSVDPPLAAAPAAGDELRAGALHWLKGQAAAAIRARRPAYSSPVEDLLEGGAVWESIVLYGALDDGRLFAEAGESRWEFRAISRSFLHSYGLARRIERLFHAKLGSLSPSGITLSLLVATRFAEGEREDRLSEHIVSFTAESAAKVA